MLVPFTRFCFSRIARRQPGKGPQQQLLNRVRDQSLIFIAMNAMHSPLLGIRTKFELLELSILSSSN